MKFRLPQPVILGVLGATSLLLVAEPALAATPGEGHGFPWAAWITSLINLAIFVAIIYKFFGAKITEFFQTRRQTLIKDLEQARELREEAEARLEEYTTRLDALEDERKRLLDEYHKQGEREKKRIVEDAKQQVEKMRADAEITIEQEVKKAIAGLERQVVDLAVGMTATMAESKLDAGKQKHLVDSYVNELSALDEVDSERAA
ncbi:MAG: F0F1 ATP synthase subunit B [Persicimonas sp.]